MYFVSQLVGSVSWKKIQLLSNCHSPSLILMIDSWIDKISSVPVETTIKLI